MAYEGDDWDALGPKPQQAITEATEAIFDAFLDALSARADEWDDLAFEKSSSGNRSGIVGPADYLAVLREGDE